MSSPHPLIASIFSPVDAGKLSGRYVETTVDANGKLIICFGACLLACPLQSVDIIKSNIKPLHHSTGKPQPVIRSLRLLALEGEMILLYCLCAYDVH